MIPTSDKKDLYSDGNKFPCWRQFFRIDLPTCIYISHVANETIWNFLPNQFFGIMILKFTGILFYRAIVHFHNNKDMSSKE
jgi:hypothetical protein